MKENDERRRRRTARREFLRATGSSYTDSIASYNRANKLDQSKAESADSRISETTDEQSRKEADRTNQPPLSKHNEESLTKDKPVEKPRQEKILPKTAAQKAPKPSSVAAKQVQSKPEDKEKSQSSTTTKACESADTSGKGEQKPSKKSSLPIELKSQKSHVTAEGKVTVKMTISRSASLEALKAFQEDISRPSWRMPPDDRKALSGWIKTKEQLEKKPVSNFRQKVRNHDRKKALG